MKTFEPEILVIGSGLAGVRAAIEAKLAGADVLLVSRSPVGMGCNTVMAKTIVSFLGDDDSPELFRSDLLRVGCGLNDEARMKSFLGGLEEQRRLLLSLPIELNTDDAGNPCFIRIPGHTANRVYRQRQRKGARFFGPIVERARALGVPMLGGVTISRLHTSDGKIAGATGFFADGEPVRIRAGAVILASGGLGSLFAANDNAVRTGGEGYGLALELGLTLRDMEFVQFYPTGLRRRGVSNSVDYEHMVMEGGAVVRNRDGADIRTLYGLEDRLVCTRDRLARAIGAEIVAGRGVGEDGKSVWFDVSAADRAMWDFYRAPNIDPAAGRVEVAPMAHFTMGGVVTDENGFTGLPGLYAAGELLGGLHGANRLAGVALAECLVTGTCAARAALRWLRENPEKPGWGSAFPDGAGLPASRVNAREAARLFARLQNVMSEHAGVVRTADGLALAKAELAELRRAANAVRDSEPSAEALGLLRSLAAAEAVVLSAEKRCETRGAHCRPDYPAQSHAFDGSLFVRRNGEGLSLQYHPKEA